MRGNLVAKLLRARRDAAKDHDVDVDVDVDVVAFGASDHAAFQFQRFAYEVEGFLRVRNAEPRVLGTLVTREPQPARKPLFTGTFDYVDASGGTGGADGARTLAIFLDLVAHRVSEKSSLATRTASDGAGR